MELTHRKKKKKNYFKDIGISLEQVQFFRDPGVSAANKNRPAFESMMKFIRRNKITEVIIYKLDRLFRDLQQQIDVINEFKMRDVKLTCITEDLDLSSANGRLTTHMRGAILIVTTFLDRKKTDSYLACVNLYSTGVKYPKEP